MNTNSLFAVFSFFQLVCLSCCDFHLIHNMADESILKVKNKGCPDLKGDHIYIHKILIFFLVLPQDPLITLLSDPVQS